MLHKYTSIFNPFVCVCTNIDIALKVPGEIPSNRNEVVWIGRWTESKAAGGVWGNLGEVGWRMNADTPVGPWDFHRVRIQQLFLMKWSYSWPLTSLVERCKLSSPQMQWLLRFVAGGIFSGIDHEVGNGAKNCWMGWSCKTMADTLGEIVEDVRVYIMFSLIIYIYIYA